MQVDAVNLVHRGRHFLVNLLLLGLPSRGERAAWAAHNLSRFLSVSSRLVLDRWSNSSLSLRASSSTLMTRSRRWLLMVSQFGLVEFDLGIEIRDEG